MGRMRVEWSDEVMDAGLLHKILSKHKLLPDALNNPDVCIAFASSLRFGVLSDGGQNPLCLLFMNRVDDGIGGLMLVTERPKLNQRKEELFEISKELRKLWFDEMGLHRVEARIPAERTQTIRILKHFGFRMETLPSGLRSAATLSGKCQNMVIMGLLPCDPVKTLHTPYKNDMITQLEI